MNILEEIKKLNFPIGQYVVVGSGPMAARGIKEPHDIDIVVSETVFNDCEKKDWETLPWTHSKIGQTYLRKGLVELYLNVNAGTFNPTTEELIKRSEMINGIPFISLDDMIQFKKEYAKNGNRKHLQDIILAEEYLKKQSQNNN